jgi:anaerobic selenocysteine-containing dehydrogenase
VPVSGSSANATGVPPSIEFHPPTRPAELAALDRYSLRLVATRKLYDNGVVVQHSPALAHLAPGTILRVNPYDFDRLGVADGAEVRLHSSRAEVRVEVAADDGVPRGTAAVYFNQPGLHAAALIDAAERVTDVRIETGASS